MYRFEKLIGLTGFKRCGKSTVTQFLCKHYGFKAYAFADALRNIASAVDPVISMANISDRAYEELIHQRKAEGFREYRYNQLIEYLGYELAKEIPDFRLFLQRLGTEGVRATFGPNVWVDALDRRVSLDGYGRVIISDVRFQSEAEWVRNNCGEVWWVQRPGYGGDDPHPSEAEIPHLPHDRILTATTLEELEWEVKRKYLDTCF